MTDDPTDTPEYRETYNAACHSFMQAGHKLQEYLSPLDTAGALNAAAIETLKIAGAPRPDISEWLRAIADALEAGDIGFKAH